MGIQGLTRLISDNAPHAIKEHKLENYFGRKIAIDASMSIYQFLIAVRQAGGEGQLTNEAGEVTSHLTGMFYRTIRLMENGIKPVFVFDGKPPTMKGGQLAKRKERQQAAEAELTKLTEEGGAAEDIERQQKRLVRASREQSEEVKTLLRLMGVPVLDAPCEAEATCAAICKAGLVYATGTEDMDALTFGTPILLRHLQKAESAKLPILEINLQAKRNSAQFGRNSDAILAQFCALLPDAARTLLGLQAALVGLDLTYHQFVDLCILLGCDYCDSIKGIGPVNGLKLIKQCGDLEGVIAHCEKKKIALPEPFPYAAQLWRNYGALDHRALPGAIRRNSARNSLTPQTPLLSGTPSRASSSSRRRSPTRRRPSASSSGPTPTRRGCSSTCARRSSSTRSASRAGSSASRSARGRTRRCASSPSSARR
jgi:flap endonuclease-1